MRFCFLLGRGTWKRAPVVHAVTVLLNTSRGYTRIRVISGPRTFTWSRAYSGPGRTRVSVQFEVHCPVVKSRSPPHGPNPIYFQRGEEGSRSILRPLVCAQRRKDLKPNLLSPLVYFHLGSTIDYRSADTWHPCALGSALPVYFNRLRCTMASRQAAWRAF